MKLEKHVLKAIEAHDRGSTDEALMHAAVAIDGTARKLFGKAGANIYKDCIRKYYWIVERFVGEGLNLVETKWTHLKLVNGNGKPILEPDLADIIYHIFRCNDVHATEIPIKFEILPKKNNHHIWHIDIANSGVRMPEAIIWALLAISVFSKVNSDIKTDGEHWLSWGSDQIGYTRFTIKEYWGKEKELDDFFLNKPTVRIKIDKLT